MPDRSPSTLTSKLQLPTARKKVRRPATADSSPQAVTCQHCDTNYFSRPRTHNLPIVGPTRYATDSPGADSTDAYLKERLVICNEEDTGGLG